MARYAVVSWRDVPSAVEASDGEETVRVPLSPRFQDLIDALAMRESASEAEAYLEGWTRGDERERSGSAAAVARAVADELEAEFASLAARRLSAPRP